MSFLHDENPKSKSEINENDQLENFIISSYPSRPLAKNGYLKSMIGFLATSWPSVNATRRMDGDIWTTTKYLTCGIKKNELMNL
jgi:hypothetical protein